MTFYHLTLVHIVLFCHACPELHKRVARERHPVVVERRRTEQYSHSAEYTDGDVDDKEDAVYDKCHVFPLVSYLQHMRTVTRHVHVRAHCCHSPVATSNYVNPSRRPNAGI